MKLPSSKSQLFEANYAHLNPEQQGVLSLIVISSIMMLGVLAFWSIGSWLLGIPELAYLDCIGFVGVLLLLVAIYNWNCSYKIARFCLIAISILVTYVPVFFYGLDSLFTLHLVILPMSGILMFTSSEKSVFVKYLISFLLILTGLLLWEYFYGAMFQLNQKQNNIINVFIAFGGLGISVYYSWLYYLQNSNSKKSLLLEREKSDRLLYSIFPISIAEQLREDNQSVAESFDDVAVVFIDIVGFTQLSSTVSPSELVHILDDVFSSFDKVVDKYGIEKIKTIGDAYMAVCGLPEPDIKHCEKVADLALEINELVKRTLYQNHQLQVRIGMHTGKVVAGVIGKRKFSYDLWGDTVNIASRFESAGTANKIHISKAVRDLLGSAYLFEERGEIDIKGRGIMDSFYLVGKA